MLKQVEFGRYSLCSEAQGSYQSKPLQKLTQGLHEFRTRYSPNAFDSLDTKASIALLQNACLCWFLLRIEQILIGSKAHWINTVNICTELVTRA